MKFLIAFAALALFVCINANPYGSSHYDGGRLAYVQDIGYGSGYGGYGNRGYGNRGYGNRGGYGYARPLVSRSSNPSAAAAAASASSGIRSGHYDPVVVPAYDLDTSYVGRSRGGYGRGY